MNQPLPAPKPIHTSDIQAALAAGLDVFRAVPGVSMAFAALFTLTGLALLAALGNFGLSPLALPFAGGFMLVGPVVLAGFFRLSERHRAGHPARLGDAFRAFAGLPAGLWMLILICGFLFLIWITDAGVLYSFMIGGDHLTYEPLLQLQGRIVGFQL